MHRLKFALFAIIALALVACSPGLIKTDGQRIAAACATASASIKVITAANELGKLSPEQLGGVVTAIGVITPICGAEQAPTLDDIKREAFLQAIQALQERAAGVQLEAGP